MPQGPASASKGIANCPNRPQHSIGSDNTSLHLLLMCVLSHVQLLGLELDSLSNSMDWSLPSSSVYGIFQARILKWVAISFSRGSS